MKSNYPTSGFYPLLRYDLKFIWKYQLQEGSSAVMSDPANIPPRVPDSTIPDQISPSTPLLLDESAQVCT